jgi:hypothetical protein
MWSNSTPILLSPIIFIWCVNFCFLVVHLGVQILCFFSLSLDLVVGLSKPPSSLTCVWNNDKLVEGWTQILVAYKSYKKFTFFAFLLVDGVCCWNFLWGLPLDICTQCLLYEGISVIGTTTIVVLVNILAIIVTNQGIFHRVLLKVIFVFTMIC